MKRAQQYTLIALILIGLCAAAVVIHARVRAEASNRTVALALDYARVQEISALTGIDTGELLKRLKAAGATHAIISEEGLYELIAQEKVLMIRQPEGVGLKPTPRVRDRVVSQLEHRLPGGRLTSDGTLWYPRAKAVNLVSQMGVGYPEGPVADCKKVGLGIVTRPIGELALTEPAISACFDAVQAVGSTISVFYGIQVPGMYDLIDYSAREMEKRGIRFGYVEMAKQLGELELAGALHSRVLRCHAITPGEMLKIPQQDAIERYLLAVRERNVRVLYVRLYMDAATDQAAAAVNYVSRLSAAIRGAGFKLGDPEPFPPVSVPPWATIAILLGLIGGAGLLIQAWWSLTDRVFWGVLVAALVVAAGASLAITHLISTVGALAAAVIFPVLGLTSVRIEQAAPRPSFLTGAGRFLVICAISAIGGIFIAALLGDLPHMMELERFRGVKLGQLVPLLLVALIFAARNTDSYTRVRSSQREGAAEWPALWAGAEDIAQSLIRYGHAALIVVGLVLVALLVFRSGNVSPVAASGFELKVRQVLSDTLVIRPRTKEVALGHPALILALALIAGGWRRGAWLGMTLGAIGQISLVNTFGHIHTPFLVSVLRDLNGIWVGILVAGIAWLVLRATRRIWRPWLGLGDDTPAPT